MGYTMDLDTTAGVTPSGEQYDAVQRKLRMNHLALVPRARGGSNLRMGDKTNVEGHNMTEDKLTICMVRNSHYHASILGSGSYLIRYAWYYDRV